MPALKRFRWADQSSPVKKTSQIVCAKIKPVPAGLDKLLTGELKTDDASSEVFPPVPCAKSAYQLPCAKPTNTYQLEYVREYLTQEMPVNFDLDLDDFSEEHIFSGQFSPKK